jgi:hypothetical protein
MEMYNRREKDGLSSTGSQCTHTKLAERDLLPPTPLPSLIHRFQYCSLRTYLEDEKNAICGLAAHFRSLISSTLNMDTSL